MRQWLWCAAVLALVALATAQAEGQRTSPHSQCQNSSDVAECVRRVEVCRNMHRGQASRERARDLMATCAATLSITLPQGGSPAESRQLYRAWARNNRELNGRLMECVHQSLFNEDGTVDRVGIRGRLTESLAEEPQLLAQLLNRLSSCPEPQQDRWQFFTCVYSGCATP